MRLAVITMLSGGISLLGVPASAQVDPPGTSGEKSIHDDATKSKNDMKENRIKIRIGTKTFAATLADNPAASAFKALLPLSLQMSDQHGNEKFFHLPSRLPSNDANIGTIRAGDLMLWSSQSVVLFYKTFPTSYSYTRLGSLDDPDGLSAAVGPKDVMVKFELEE